MRAKLVFPLAVLQLFFLTGMTGISFAAQTLSAPVKGSSLIALYGQTCGLKEDGTVVTTKNSYLIPEIQVDTSKWTDIIQIAGSESHLVGLKKDGTVVASGGKNEYGELDVGQWKDIIQVAAGYSHTVGLKRDGTVVAVGSDWNDQCKVSEWRDIVRVCAGGDITCGIKKDGTVVAVGYSDAYKQTDVGHWRDIADVVIGTVATVGIKKDGTLVTAGIEQYWDDDLWGPMTRFTDWKDIVQIAFGTTHTVGLKKDGTVVAVGHKTYRNYGQTNVKAWKDVVQISANYYYTVGLKKDGTVLVTGSNDDNEYTGVNKWKKIKVAFTEPTIQQKPSEQEVTVDVNGKKVEFSDSKPYIDSNGRVIVPVKFVAEQLGADVGWDKTTRQVTISKNDTVIILEIGKKQILINGQAQELDTEAILKDGRTCIPIRAVVEALGGMSAGMPKAGP